MASIESLNSASGYVAAAEKQEEVVETEIRSASESPQTLALAASDTITLSIKAAEAIMQSADGAQSGADSITASASSSVPTANDDAIWTSIQVTLSRLNEMNRHSRDDNSGKTASKTDQERRIENLKAQIHQLMMTQDHLSPATRTSQLTRLSHELTAILMQYNDGRGTTANASRTGTRSV